MKVAIDISQVIYGTGVSTYIKNLVANLQTVDAKNDYVLFGGSLRRKGELDKFISRFEGNKLKGFVYPIPPTLANLLWNKLHIIPIENFIGNVDVFHSSDWAQPPSRAFKVTTLHDLVPIKFPNLSLPKIVSVHQARFKWILKEVDRVIVPLKSTADDAVKFGLDPRKIRIIPEAPDVIFKPTKRIEIERLKRKYRISGNYLLAIGVNPRKNTQVIIDAFEKVKTKIDLKLVIVGNPYIKTKLIRGVIYTGHVEDEEMPVFYSGAECLVYPSLYEGFGLPILEAFACETPVITSNIGSMAEIAGNAAILVDPYDIDSVAGGIFKAFKNKKMLKKKGRTAVGKFSWEKTAKETLGVYEEIGI